MVAPPTNGRTQLFLSLMLLGLLLLFTVLLNSSTEARPYDLSSAAPDGLLALRLWLTDMGYELQETMGTDFQLPATTKLLFILPTTHSYTNAEAMVLTRWVTAGGTAVIVGPQSRDEELISAFGVQPGETTPLFFTVTPQQPLLTAVTEIDLTGGLPTLDLTDAPATVPILATAAGQITAAVQAYGAGTVWHLSRHHTFVNAQLRDPAQAALILPFLRGLSAGSTIRIDTYHLWGPATADAIPVRTLQEWLYYTTWGWALLFALAITALFWLLQGRRLGPPLPVQAEVRRREAAEYVIAMANLARRARHRDMIAQYHKRRLKRSVGHRAHIDAALDDADFVRRLADSEIPTTTANAYATANDVHAVLQHLDQAKDERALVEAVTRLDAIIGSAAIPSRER